MPNKPVVGVDVAKDWLDIAILGDPEGLRIANTPEAVTAWLEQARPGRVAFEPTGGYESVLRHVLREKNILFDRVHPNQIIAFRQSRGIKAKTDRIDAKSIAAFAADRLARHDGRSPMIGDDVLRELAARRRQLVDSLQAERCRLAMAKSTSVRTSIEEVVATLSTSLDALEAELARHIQAQPETAELARLLRTLKGIGPITATTLIADLPELGYLTGKQIAALAGLAPVTRQSGKSERRAHTGHGRTAVRQVLFNAARSVIRHPSPLKTFYDRLVDDNQRPGKVALVALMRKILVIANAIARERKPWRGQHA
jgi:transposase